LSRRRLAAAAGGTLLIVIGIAVAAGGGGDSSTRPATPTITGKATEEDAPGVGPELYVVGARGGRPRRLTISAYAKQPAWQPNEHISYSGARCDDCYAHLFEVDARGAGRRRVPGGPRHLFHPSWSPDGRSLAAAAIGRGLYVLSVSGSAPPRRLTSNGSDDVPAWSPGGDLIAFDRQVTPTNYDLFTVSPATRRLRRLTRDAAQQTNPSWSPDGSRLAFAEQQSSGRWSVFTMRLDGSGRKRVTGATTSAQEPAWSPDGTRIAFILQHGDAASVAVVDVARRTRPRTLTGPALRAYAPAWSPDGRRIAFSAETRSSRKGSAPAG
jgi:Tol biopolymer transport system component